MPALSIPQLQLIRRSFDLANRYVVELITGEGVAQPAPDGAAHVGRWYDIRALIDPREQPPAALDMHVECIAYAVDAGLARRDRARPYLICIVNRE